MHIRKEKENEFYLEHIDTFKKLNLVDPFFTIKTAFFQKGKFGRQVQLFQWELEKGEDIYIEFYDNVTDSNNKIVDLVPMNSDRALFKYKYNPFFSEEYEKKENTNSQGEPYYAYVIPVNELIVVLKDGTEITFSLYEKRKASESELIPRLQKNVTTSIFPDFEEEYSTKKELNLDIESSEEKTSDILLRIAEYFKKLAQKLK